MRDIRLFNSMFEGESASVSGRCEETPKNIRWVDRETDTVVFTDSHVVEGAAYPTNARKVLWLLEPHSLHPENYDLAVEAQDEFDMVCSHHLDLCTRHGWSFVPFGGCRLAREDWSIPPKTGNLSMLASAKNTMPGHKLRHAILEKYGMLLDKAYGDPPIEYKLPALAPYRFSIVVESDRYSHYFTEKLIDCFLAGTIPVYWGDPDIGRFFNNDGILPFSTLDDLEQIKDAAWEDMYARRIGPRNQNFELAKQYICTEDWLPL